jgi:ATP-dependent Clp protease ATP-binding subunit ClpC
MATLHVRNVPEPLYEALRRCAEENGRSIAGQAVALLNESLSTGRRGFPFFGRRVMSINAEPLQAFGERARSRVVYAEQVARELGHSHVGTDDLLLALLAEPRLPLAEVVGGSPYSVTYESVLERVERGRGSPTGSLPFAPETKQALELALRESLQSRGPEIEPWQLLLGVAGAPGPGGAILSELGLLIGVLRALLIDAITWSAPIRRFRVVELEGTAEEWEEQLVGGSEGPYELIEIVGTRAIFGLRRP